MLLGRSLEIAAVDQLMSDARSGRGGVLVLRGEAGVGKSVLLAHARAAADGFLVLQAVGIESEAELAFAGLHQLLRPVIDGIATLPAPQSAALRAAFALSDETVAERFRISLGALGVLAAAADELPVLCLVDDAQWLDEASAAAIMFVARRLEAERLAILLAARDDDVARFEASGLPELRLEPLQDRDARALASAQLGDAAAAAAVDWVLANANGNPLALVELPQALTPDQASGREPLAGVLPPATSVERAFLNRVRHLPANVQRLLLVAASEETGDRATIERAADAFGFAASELSIAETHGLVGVGLDRIAFRHPLVRSAVYRGATFAEREGVHRTLADVLVRPGDADRRAWHRAAATTGTDDDVADELEATAERARTRGGFSGAATALERAAQLSAAPEVRARRLVHAGRAAWRAGQLRRATTLLDAAGAVLDDPLLRADREHVRARIEARSGSMLSAGSRLLDAAAKVSRRDPHRSLEMLLDVGLMAGRSGDLASMGEAATIAASLPRGEDGTEAVLRDLLVGAGNLMLGRGAADVSRIRAAVARAGESDDVHVLAWAAAGASTIGEGAAETAILDRARAIARASGAVDTLVDLLETVVGSAFIAGRYYSVAAEATEGLRLAREVGLRNPLTFHLAALGVIAGLNGDDDVCLANAAEVSRTISTTGMANANSIAQWGVAVLDLARGAPDKTATRLERLRAAPLGEAHPFGVLIGAPELVEANLQVGRRDEADAAFAPLKAFAAGDAPTWAQATAARCRALLADGDEAERAFEDALALLTNLNRRFDGARTHLLFGAFLRRQRRRGDARTQLRTAVETFERLGAEPWAERARVELRATGETARKRDPSTVTQLTPQEMQIARLVGAGSSNKDVATQLFLSPRTVEYHLAKVFSKLGIASRADLIRQAAVLEPAG
jgi:DNA-binding CsgD family transcriptional regulator